MKNPFYPTQNTVKKPRPLWRSGIIGLYADDKELAEVLDKEYGKGKWRVSGSLLETVGDDGTWSSYCRVIHYTSGRFEIYDETKD